MGVGKSTVGRRLAARLGLEFIDTDHEVERRERRTIAAVALVDCGFRLPTDPLPGAVVRIGDCVAPRTVLEAVLEARRAARTL